MNPDQIRTIIREFRDRWPEMFPGRQEVPKTLVFAKTDRKTQTKSLRAFFGVFLSKIAKKVKG